MKKVESIFGGQLRVRVMGILRQEDTLLMINHIGLNDRNELWMPPGGGVKFGESVRSALKREFLEESALEVAVGRFIFANEFLNPPFHAIELFFEVSLLSGMLHLGNDPEMGEDTILKDLRFMKMTEINALDNDSKHAVFRNIQTIDELYSLRNHFIFE